MWNYILIISPAKSQAANRSVYRVPDEQRLYRELMWGYENSVRPVINANSTILVKFRLTLNQIIDLVSIGEALNSFYVVLCRVTVKYLYYKLFFQTKFGMCKAQGS